METSMEKKDYTNRPLYDTNGDKIGTLEELYYDEPSGRPEWFLVKTGWFGTGKSFVPAVDVRPGVDDRLTVPYTEDRVKDAPHVGNGEELSEDEEQRLYSYYNLEYNQTAEPAKWGPTDRMSEEEIRRSIRRPSQCIHLDNAVIMGKLPLDGETDESEL